MERVVEAAGSVLLGDIKTEPVDIIDSEANSPGAGESGTTVVNILLLSLIVLLLCFSTPDTHPQLLFHIKYFRVKRDIYVNILTRVIRSLLVWMHAQWY